MTSRPKLQEWRPEMCHACSFDVFAACRGAVLAANPEDNVLFWNSAAEQLFGFTAAAMLGSPFWSAWLAAQRASLKAEFQTLNTQPFFQSQTPLLDSHGLSRSITLRVLKVDGHPPTDTRFLGFCQEIPENTPVPSSFHALNQSQKAQAINASAILFSGAPAEEASAPPALLKDTQFLAKPFDNHDLLRLVRATLNLVKPPAQSPNQPAN